jgi:magnesium-transporting ATPase (P-type)
MSTIHRVENRGEDDSRIAYIKGAPKEVLDLCTGYISGGREAGLDDSIRGSVMAANDSFARKGLRVLAVAQRCLDGEDLPIGLSAYTPELIEQRMTFLGLVAMSDPPRPEVAAAVEECAHAGIRIIMITGDYGLTAESIARHIGIIKGDSAGNFMPKATTTAQKAAEYGMATREAAILMSVRTYETMK